MRENTIAGNTAAADLPATGFVRLKLVLKLIPVCSATWWNGVKAEKFPKPVKLGRCTLWRVEDIRALIEKMGGGDTE